MTETQWARIASDLEYLQALLYGACASPLVWLPLTICVVAAAVFACRGFNERHSYTRVGRNASLGCLALASAILVLGTWSYSNDQSTAELPSTTVTAADSAVTERG